MEQYSNRLCLDIRKKPKLGTARVNTKKQFTIKIKKQKKNTVLKIVSKDRYGNAVSVNYTVK